jgi:hypothetical protein
MAESMVPIGNASAAPTVRAQAEKMSGRPGPMQMLYEKVAQQSKREYA